MNDNYSDRELAVFVDAYLEAGLWATIDDTTEERPLDDTYDIDACANRDDVEAECRAFLDDNWLTLCSITGRRPADDELAQHGHDFLLTRDRHGAGFWDRGYGAAGEALSEAARVYGDSGFSPIGRELTADEEAAWLAGHKMAVVVACTIDGLPYVRTGQFECTGSHP